MQQNQTGSKAYLIRIVMVAVLGGLLFGYDTAVISGAEKGLQAFFMGATDFTYTDFWHGFTSSSALIGCIIGSALSGVLASNWGRKRTLIFAGVMFFVSAWGSMCPETMVLPEGKPNLTLLIVFNIYRVIGGVGVGLASAVCPMYIGEIAPSNIRGMLVSWNQFAIIFGQLVVYFVNFFILGDHIAPAIQSIGNGMNEILNGGEAAWAIETGWRYMFGSEMVPAGLFAVLICFVPETPRYLAMVGQDDKALHVLTRINGDLEAENILSEIKNTVTEKTEKLMTYGFLCIFVGVMLSVFQQAVGIMPCSTMLLVSMRQWASTILWCSPCSMVSSTWASLAWLFSPWRSWVASLCSSSVRSVWHWVLSVLPSPSAILACNSSAWFPSWYIQHPSCSLGDLSAGCSSPRYSQIPSVVQPLPSPLPSSGFSTGSSPLPSCHLPIAWATGSPTACME